MPFSVLVLKDYCIIWFSNISCLFGVLDDGSFLFGVLDDISCLFGVLDDGSCLFGVLDDGSCRNASCALT
jgi:hypothetical protein